MSKGFPSMTALLGLIALAGYQNRDKLAEMIRGTGTNPQQIPGQNDQHSGLGGILGSLRGALGGTGTGGFLNDGLRDLQDHFRKNGRGDVAQSWINHGPNQEISPDELKTTLGSDVLSHLSPRTGLSQQEVLARLSRELPSAVDNYTPDGRLAA